MSDIFRFVAMRPPQRAANSDVGEKLVQTHPNAASRTGLYEAVSAPLETGDLITAAQLARAWAQSADFVSDLSGVETAFHAVDAFLLDNDDRPTPAALSALLKKSGLDPATLDGNDKYARDRRRIADSLLAIALSRTATPALRERLLRAMKIAGLAERVAAKSDAAGSADRIHDFLRDSVVVLPADLLLPPRDGEDGQMEAEARPTNRRGGRREALVPEVRVVGPDEPPEEMADELAVITDAIVELREAIHTVAPDSDGSWVPAASARRSNGGDRTSAFRTRRPSTVPARPGAGEGSDMEALPDDAIVASPWAVGPASLSRLSRSTLGALRTVSDTARAVDIPSAIERLEYRAAEIGARVVSRPETAIVALGTGVVEVPTVAMRKSAATGVTQFGTSPTLARQPGIADLLVVRQQIKRYELGEIAHVENVLRGEDKARVHRTSTTTEDAFLTETSHAEELEMDTQSTSRFEMSHEVASAMAEDIKFDAGVRIAGQMGPVSIAASVGFAYSHSKEESERNATTFAKETSERARSRVEDNVRELRTRRTTTQVEETNTHGIDNKGQPDHVIGVYRWLDKVYEAQIYNYGRRLLVEFVVPEPAAFFIHSLANRPIEGVTLKRPDPPVKPDTTDPLSPADISVANYLDFVRQYEVADVSPPPRMFTTVGLAWDEPWAQNMPDPSTPAKLLYKARKEIKIPAGYRAARAAGVVFASAWLADSYLAIGSTALRGSNGGPGASMPWTFNVPLADEEGELPIALTIENAWGYAMSLEILCERTDAGFVKWQLTTYEAIMRAYYELKSAYESQVAAAATRAGIAIAGRNAVENRAIERTELRKSAIAMLTGQSFNGFGAVAPQQPLGYPEIDFMAAGREGPIVQFFEQAFEWPNLTYTFYPYYWGSKDGWLTLSQVNDPDPIFLSFLRAGYARVVAPVRPGFEQAMLYYLATGDIWNGSQAPQVGDPLYVSIVQEIQEQLQAPSAGTPVGQPWEFVLPTTLVMLQDDATLPTWP